ncbi:transmembrane protein 42 isoform X1 [Pseudopipra pipra]|uniref:transmembrane protein 42 isoform X1 n=1 Tax=Pseudopipra pipra TaxID=415032 RepID=UPI00313A29A9
MRGGRAGGGAAAAAAGLLGAAAAAAAKLALGPGGEAAGGPLPVLLRVSCVGLVFACNAVMWTVFAKALRLSSSSAAASVTTTASNFISSGLTYVCQWDQGCKEGCNHCVSKRCASGKQFVCDHPKCLWKSPQKGAPAFSK